MAGNLPEGRKISCRAAVYSAWDKMEKALFRPFDMGKWFALGLAAWLANIGQGGFNWDFSLPNGGDFSGFFQGQPSAHSELPAVMRGLFQNDIFSITTIVIICVIALAVVFLSLAIALVVAWVRARGSFVFIHDLVTSTTQISVPWKKYSKQGNSLFFLRLAVSVIMFLPILLCIGAVILMLLPSISRMELDALGIGGIVFGVLAMLIIVLVSSVIGLSIDGFVVPLMYRNRCTAWTALKASVSLVNRHPLAFVRYFLMYFLLSVCASVAILLFVFSTCCFCCIGLVVFSLPYIWAVAMLPVLVFFRYYSIDFLAQFGNEYSLVSGGGAANADI